jgi:preprotein translocase subunit SecG
MYDWALTFGQEVELILRQRWSPMTVLYLIVRYGGLFYAVISISFAVPTISTTDAGCLMIKDALDWMDVVVGVVLGVIMIARLHAMYQGSRKVLIFLVVIFLVISTAITVMAVVITTKISGEEFVLSGTYLCMISYAGDSLFLASMTWILATVWEVLALCLAVWITVKHFRELRRCSARGVVGDCFKVLIQSHVNYFASFLFVSCFKIGLSFPTLSAIRYPEENQDYASFVQFFNVLVFVLGPRLILSIRQYNAELVAGSDTATNMTSIVFQEHDYVSTSSSV